MSNLASIGIVLLLSYVVFSRMRAWYRLRHIPGPFWARWSHFWIMRRILNGTIIEKVDEVHKQYGSIVCVAPDLVLLSDVGEIKQIKHPRSSWGRSSIYHGVRMEPGVDSILSTRDEKVHKTIRGKMIPGYLSKGVDGVHEVVDEHVTTLINTLRKNYAAENKPCDLARLVIYFTTDLISCLAFGSCFKCMNREADFHGYIGAVSSGAPLMMMLAIHPLWQALMDIPILVKVFPVILQKVMDIAKLQVSERFGEKKILRNDILGSFVANGLSQNQLETETVLQLAAGSDTTATAIRATMLHLMASPNAYTKLQNEIDDAAKSGKITTSPVPFSEAKELPYLQAVIKEGMRIFPPAPNFFPNSSAKDEMVCGLHIPAGVSVDVSIKRAMRDKGVFGEDADVFRPERWIGVDADKAKVMDDTWRYLWNGPSRWECLGKSIALVELNKIFVELLRHFDFTLVDPANPWKTHGSRIWIIEDMYCEIEDRQVAK